MASQACPLGPGRLRPGPFFSPARRPAGPPACRLAGPPLAPCLLSPACCQRAAVYDLPPPRPDRWPPTSAPRAANARAPAASVCDPATGCRRAEAWRGMPRGRRTGHWAVTCIQMIANFTQSTVKQSLMDLRRRKSFYSYLQTRRITPARALSPSTETPTGRPRAAHRAAPQPTSATRRPTAVGPRPGARRRAAVGPGAGPQTVYR
jgi:hypothetical protein